MRVYPQPDWVLVERTESPSCDIFEDVPLLVVAAGEDSKRFKNLTVRIEACPRCARMQDDFQLLVHVDSIAAVIRP